MTPIYTGIGSRETPANILTLMTHIARMFDQDGWTLRSGGADGADLAFEAGVESGRKEIYLPWRKFNGSDSPLFKITSSAMDLAEKFHPAWDLCGHTARKLHARNGYQILGQDLNTPSGLVICWTKEARRKGGTGQALRIAEAHEIPILDLALPEIAEHFKAWADLKPSISLSLLPKREK